MREGNI